MSYQKCFHCGAGHGLHRSETYQCPLHGIEETREGKKQQWAETTFLDYERGRLEELAPEMFETIKQQHEAIDRLFALLIEKTKDFYPSKSGQPWDACVMGSNIIKKLKA